MGDHFSALGDAMDRIHRAAPGGANTWTKAVPHVGMIGEHPGSPRRGGNTRQRGKPNTKLKLADLVELDEYAPGPAQRQTDELTARGIPTALDFNVMRHSGNRW